MTNAFVLGELLLYFVPIAVIYLLVNEFQEILTVNKEWPLSLAIVLLPMWMVLIHAFSSLIFGYSLLNLALFLAVYCVFIHLFQYVRTIDTFTIKGYYLKAGNVLFYALSAFLFSLVLLRIFTYFHS